MVQMTGAGDGKTVHDPCCGSGRLLLAAAKADRSRKFYGWDIDLQCVRMTALNLAFQNLYGSDLGQQPVDRAATRLPHRLRRAGIPGRASARGRRAATDGGDGARAIGGQTDAHIILIRADGELRRGGAPHPRKIVLRRIGRAEGNRGMGTCRSFSTGVAYRSAADPCRGIVRHATRGHSTRSDFLN